MAVQLSPAALLRERPSAIQKQVLTAAIRIAEESEMPLYLVGGATRDLLRTGELRDLDLVVTGDGTRYAQELATRLDGQVRIHDRFQTAEITFSELRIDVATARHEDYPQPGKLPQVTKGTIEQDLARRDFTVNAMAIRLWPRDDAELIDPYEGSSDLRNGKLRILHERSFIDDPTRLLRGIRLGARMGFAFEPRTKKVAVSALEGNAFAPLSGSRLRQELILLLEEEESVLSAVQGLADMRVLTVLDARLEPSRAAFGRLRALTEERRRWDRDGRQWPCPPHWWLVRLMILVGDSTVGVREAVASRLDLEGRAASSLRDFPSRLAAAQAALRAPEVPPHAVRGVLDGLTSEELALLFVTRDSSVLQRIEYWLDSLRSLRLGISGDEIIARGFAPGPLIGRALQATLEARLDGRIQEAEEIDFAVRFLKEARKG